MGEAALIILLGVTAGAVAGLFGVGGGIIFVPTLTLVLGLGQLEAEATSLLAIIPVAILGSWRQTRTGHVRWRDATVMGLASVVTAVVGALIADVAPERALRIGFAILLVATAIQLIQRARAASRTADGGS
ncbi:MAG TPA: sulfite exporter TauE/SafE family protein [Miltoncostaeaceae bacterium]|nr:sulfite exporter TauE/SafE family protein [Miltoncostaeaceae bacterium]